MRVPDNGWLKEAMKYLKFILMALGIPWIYTILAIIALFVILLLAGCVDSGPWILHKDGSYGPWWWHNHFFLDKNCSKMV